MVEGGETGEKPRGSPGSPGSVASLQIPGGSSGNLDDSRQYRLVLLGAGQTGKTSLVWRFMHGKFLTKYQPTVEDSYRHLIQLPDGRYKCVEFLDTAGMHQFPAMRELSIKSGQAFVIVYAINNRESFNEALTLINLILRLKNGGSVPMILVGNKQDVEGGGRQVSSEEGSKLAMENSCSFIETSAMHGTNVPELFLQLLYRGFECSAQRPASSDTTTTPATRRRTLSGRSRRRLGRSKSAGAMVVPVPSSPVIKAPVEKTYSAVTSRKYHQKEPVIDKRSVDKIELDENGQPKCIIL